MLSFGWFEPDANAHLWPRVAGEPTAFPALPKVHFRVAANANYGSVAAGQQLIGTGQSARQSWGAGSAKPNMHDGEERSIVWPFACSGRQVC